MEYFINGITTATVRLRQYYLQPRVLEFLKKCYFVIPPVFPFSDSLMLVFLIILSSAFSGLLIFPGYFYRVQSYIYNHNSNG